MTDRRTTPDDIAGRLRQLRGDRSLKDFAAELGIDQAEYVAYETARREIPASLLVALIERGSIDPAWVLTGQRFGTVAQSATAAAAAYAAILEAAQRANVTLTPEMFAYAITAAWSTAARNGSIDATHADVVLRLATINGNRLP